MSARDATELNPREVYGRRFAADASFRSAMWRVICTDYLQRFIPAGATVLDVAAGHCEFINNIRAAHKIAVDLNDAASHYADPDVRVLVASAIDLSAVEGESVDIVFISNFLEHISKPDITRTLVSCRRVLRPGGRIIILQPNIRYVIRDYWMFFDHVTPIDDRALVEVLEIVGFRITLVHSRFLPYTSKRRPPRAIGLLRLYLRLPLLWRIFGGQALVIAEK
jgi:ubiquinone/menaquinone biosynthesis C-methylase UbiE